MADDVKVKVLRDVGGFAVGDERELSPSDAKRLEARGIVEILKTKAAKPGENKMQPAPDNKSTKAAE
ncbi:hypothetical protein [Brevundimonas bullata]